MLLAIDVGNTNTVFAVHDGQRVLASGAAAPSGQRTADEYFVWLRQLMDFGMDRGHDLLGRGLLGGAAGALQSAGARRPLLPDPRRGGRPAGRQAPAAPRVDPAAEVGADRLVNTVGAHDRYGGDLIVVDFGTATTFDVVDSDGAYVGGVISPGVNLSLKALHDAAAALPFIDVTRPEHVVGTNTVACMQSGIYWGYIGLVEGMCARIRAERARTMTVIGTGGLSTLFAQGTDVLQRIDTDLTIHGLVLIDRLNRE